MVIPISNLNCTPKYKAGPVFTIAVLVNASRPYFTFGFMLQGGGAPCILIQYQRISTIE